MSKSHPIKCLLDFFIYYTRLLFCSVVVIKWVTFFKTNKHSLCDASEVQTLTFQRLMWTNNFFKNIFYCRFFFGIAPHLRRAFLVKLNSISTATRLFVLYTIHDLKLSETFGHPSVERLRCISVYHIRSESCACVLYTAWSRDAVQRLVQI